jgi:hypothetical protein
VRSGRVHGVRRVLRVHRVQVHRCGTSGHTTIHDSRLSRFIFFTPSPTQHANAHDARVVVRATRTQMLHDAIQMQLDFQSAGIHTHIGVESHRASRVNPVPSPSNQKQNMPSLGGSTTRAPGPRALFGRNSDANRINITLTDDSKRSQPDPSRVSPPLTTQRRTRRHRSRRNPHKAERLWLVGPVRFHQLGLVDATHQATRVAEEVKVVERAPPALDLRRCFPRPIAICELCDAHSSSASSSRHRASGDDIG